MGLIREKGRMNMLRRSSFLLFVGLSAFLLLSAAPDAVAAEPGTVTMTLTAVKKDAEPPAVKREDVQLYVNKDRTQIAEIGRASCRESVWSREGGGWDDQQ